LTEIQERVDGLTLEWLTHMLDEMDAASEFEKEHAETLTQMLTEAQADIEKRRAKYTNLQVLRGGKCNAQCRFCFIQRLEVKDPAITDYLQEIRYVNYSKEKLFLAMLHARMAYNLNEILFTSYGDPLANAAAKLPEEVKTAKELGYPQITLLTNGLNLNEQRIDELCEAGLTNLTVSLHTKDPTKHKDLVRPLPDITLEDILPQVQYALEKGLTTRINVAYSNKVESAEELIAWAEKLGVQQLTFIEMIPGNQWCVDNHRPLPEKIEGYIKTFELPWGLQVWQPKEGVEGPSVGLCSFGKNSPTFDEQEKNLMLVLATNPEGPAGPVLKAGALYGYSGRLKSWQV